VLKRLVSSFSVFFALAALPARAALVDNGGGFIYDTDKDVTFYDAPPVSRNWDQAMAWAAGLNVGGVAGWRLPARPAAGLSARGYNNQGELGHLYYDELHGPAGGPLVNKGPFQNLGGGYYWTNTLYHDPDLGDAAWAISFGNGYQGLLSKTAISHYSGYSLAVHAGSVLPYSITGSLTPTRDLSNAMIIGTAEDGSLFAASLGSFAAHTTTPFALPSSGSRPTWYTIVALYDPAHSGVAVGTSVAQLLVATALGLDWNGYFGPGICYATCYSEPYVAGAVGSGDKSFLEGFYTTAGRSHLGVGIGQRLSIIDFSGATDGGWAVAYVPEPGTLPLAATGLAGLAGVRRKRVRAARA